MQCSATYAVTQWECDIVIFPTSTGDLVRILLRPFLYQLASDRTMGLLAARKAKLISTPQRR